jgi:hypothetical protein
MWYKRRRVDVPVQLWSRLLTIRSFDRKTSIPEQWNLDILKQENRVTYKKKLAAQLIANYIDHQKNMD